jgi:hypothetical protein
MILKLEPFCMVSVQKTPDGQGGSHTVYTDGASIEAAAVNGQTAQSAVTRNPAMTAQMPDPAPQYALYTRRTVLLPFHAIVKRLRDGQYFRILTDSADAAAPAGSRLDLRYYGAEKWRMPDDEG